MNDAPRFLLAVTLFLSLAASPALADTVQLRNGNSLTGDARVLANGDVEVHSAMGVWTVAAHRVERVIESVSAEEEAATRLQEEPDLGADELYRMGRAAQSEGAETLAVRLFERALASDPDHEPTRRALGYTRDGDRWLTESELRRSRGEVSFRGRWLTPEEHARLLELEALEETRRGLEAARRVEQARLRQLWLQQARSLAAYRSRPPVHGIPYGSVLGFVGVPTLDPFTGRPLRQRAPEARPAPPREAPAAPAPAPRRIEPEHNRSSFRPPADG